MKGEPPKFLLVSILIDDIENESCKLKVAIKSMATAEYTLSFFGHQYCLRQVVLCSSTRTQFGHYSGINVLPGNALVFYDGMPTKKPQLRQIAPDDKFHDLMHGGYISALMYVLNDPNGADQKSSVSGESKLGKISSPQSQTFQTKKRKGPRLKLPTKRNKNQSEQPAQPVRSSGRQYRKGLSVVQVSNRGNLPKCRSVSCGKLIPKPSSTFLRNDYPYDSWHIVVRKQHDDGYVGPDKRIYLSDKHYCLDCLDDLTAAELLELKKIVAEHSVLDDFTKDIIALKILDRENEIEKAKRRPK